MKPICIVFLLILFWISACGPKKTESIPVFELKAEPWDYKISDIVSLETGLDFLISGEAKVKFGKRGIFLLDNNRQDAIHAFSPEGNYQGRLVQVGEGPGQVNNITDFLPSDEGIEVLTGKGENSKILFFNYEGEIIEESNLGLLAFSFHKTQDGEYLFNTGYNLPLEKERLTRWSKDGEKLQVYLVNDYEGVHLPMSETNFFNSREKIFYKEVFNPTVYEVEKDSLRPAYYLDFGRYGVPEGFWQKDIMDIFGSMSEQGFADIWFFSQNERHAYIHVVKQQNREMEHHILLRDHQTGEIKKREIDTSGSDLFKQPIGMAEDGKLLFLVHPVTLKNHAENEELELKWLPLIKGLDREDNPLIIRVDVE